MRMMNINYPALVRSISLPTLFTLTRLIASPLLVPLLIIIADSLQSNFFHVLVIILFVMLGLTDFLDGYFARTLKQETALGKVLDPLADKFFLYSSLIGFLVVDRIFFYWVIIFIGREFFVMALRLLAVENGLSIGVSKLAKGKTAVQFIYIILLVTKPLVAHETMQWFLLEKTVLFAALFLSVFSAYDYCKNFIQRAQVRVYEHNFV